MNAEDLTAFNQTVTIAQTGQKEHAYEQFKTLLKVNDNHLDPNLLLWLAFTSPKLEESEIAINRANSINSNVPGMQSAIDWLTSEKAKAQPSEPKYDKEALPAPQVYTQPPQPAYGQPTPTYQQSMVNMPLQRPSCYAPQATHIYQQPMMPPQQPGYYPPRTVPYAVPMMGQPGYGVSPVVVINNTAGPGCLVRGLWYVFIGWWLGGLWMGAGWFLCTTVIGLPIGLMMLNSVPRVLTLRPKGVKTTVQYNQYGQLMVSTNNTSQHSMLIRSIYFLLVGWWLSGIWCSMAYFCFLLILPIPLGIIMLDRLPYVITLRKN